MKAGLSLIYSCDKKLSFSKEPFLFFVIAIADDVWWMHFCRYSFLLVLKAGSCISNPVLQIHFSFKTF